MYSTSLLQSRVHHQRVRILSRKAREIQANLEEHENRKEPRTVDIDENLSTAHTSEPAENRLIDCLSDCPPLENVLSSSPVVSCHSRQEHVPSASSTPASQTTNLSRTQIGQRRRQQAERNKRLIDAATKCPRVTNLSKTQIGQRRRQESERNKRLNLQTNRTIPPLRILRPRREPQENNPTVQNPTILVCSLL
jgi:hypothetical protein